MQIWLTVEKELILFHILLKIYQSEKGIKKPAISALEMKPVLHGY